MRERSGVAVESVDTDPRAELRPARPSDEATHRALLIGSQEPRDRPISFHFVAFSPGLSRSWLRPGKVEVDLGIDLVRQGRLMAQAG